MSSLKLFRDLLLQQRLGGGCLLLNLLGFGLQGLALRVNVFFVLPGGRRQRARCGFDPSDFRFGLLCLSL